MHVERPSFNAAEGVSGSGLVNSVIASAVEGRETGEDPDGFRASANSDATERSLGAPPATISIVEGRTIPVLAIAV